MRHIVIEDSSKTYTFDANRITSTCCITDNDSFCIFVLNVDGTKGLVRYDFEYDDVETCKKAYRQLCNDLSLGM